MGLDKKVFGTLKPERSVHMKRFIWGSVFLFISTFVFGDVPSVVVHEFESRARDVHEDDLLTVAVLFADFLGARGTVDVVEGTHNPDYSISGLMTQLGTSITFSVTLRDNTTFSVLSSVSKQYTLENIWDNSVGIPGQLSDIANSIASAISTEHNRRLQEIQAELARVEMERQTQLAQEEEARRQDEARRRHEANRREFESLIVGTWGAPSDEGPRIFILNSDGTFTASLPRDRFFNRGSRNESHSYRISGTFTTTFTSLNGRNRITFSGTMEETTYFWTSSSRPTVRSSSFTGRSPFNATVNVYRQSDGVGRYFILLNQIPGLRGQSGTQRTFFLGRFVHGGF